MGKSYFASFFGLGVAIQAPSTLGTSGQVLVTDGSGVTTWESPSVPVVDNGVCGGRLTLTTGDTTFETDVTDGSTLYYTPMTGNLIALRVGGNWVLRQFTERSLALSGLTSESNYDVFAYDDAGTVTLELGPVWTNNTTRGTDLISQDGVLVLSGDTTRRYLGTIRATGGTTTTSNPARRLVWNRYNQRRMALSSTVAAVNAYAVATWRKFNNTTATQVDFVLGGPAIIDASFGGRVITGTGIKLFSTGIDSDVPIIEIGANNTEVRQSGSFARLLAPGYHFSNVLQSGSTSASFQSAYQTISYLG